MNDVYAAPSSQYVDEGVLEQRREHEDETHRHPDVDRLDVRDARQRRVDERRLRRRRQHGQQADGRRVWSVVTSRVVSRPMETRAGLASTFNQNETQDKMTINMLGT